MSVSSSTRCNAGCLLMSVCGSRWWMVWKLSHRYLHGEGGGGGGEGRGVVVVVAVVVVVVVVVEVEVEVAAAVVAAVVCDEQPNQRPLPAPPSAKGTTTRKLKTVP